MAGGKNTHMTHLAEAIITDGKQGGKDAIELLKMMSGFLAGDPKSKVKVTTKWDGAPAVVCGIDPSDGQFFVGTKSVFNKNNPKVAKSVQQIQELYQGGVVPKLVDAFNYLKDAGIKGVLQGDLMFTNDKKMETINGDRLVTFRPNTITYAIDPNTKLGKQINKASLGIVFHTKYTGATLAEMKSSFDVKESDYKASKSVWIQRAEFTDITGAASMTKTERKNYEAAIRRAEGSLKQTGSMLDDIQSGKATLGFDTEFLKFFNGYVKAGKDIPSVEKAYSDYLHHLGKEYDKSIKPLKRLDSQIKKTEKFVKSVEFITSNAHRFKMIIATYMNLEFCNKILVNKMKVVTSLRLFVNMGDRYETTSPEGFVGITSKGAVKLVDRLEFSRLNFTVPKQW